MYFFCFFSFGFVVACETCSLSDVGTKTSLLFSSCAAASTDSILSLFFTNLSISVFMILSGYSFLAKMTLSFFEL